MNSISDLLTQPNRRWKRFSPANEAEIKELVNSVETNLPQEFLDLLEFSNGGEGDIALQPLLFYLYEIKEIINLKKNEFYKTEFPNHLFFGGNGGLEIIAFDLRKNPYSVVMIDPIAGEESAIEISPNIAEFIKAIGLEYKENART